MSTGFAIWKEAMYSTMPRALRGASPISWMMPLCGSLGSSSPIGAAGERFIRSGGAEAGAGEIGRLAGIHHNPGDARLGIRRRQQQPDAKQRKAMRFFGVKLHVCCPPRRVFSAILVWARRLCHGPKTASQARSDKEMQPGGGAMDAIVPTKLNRQQILGFWASWSGWTLDGMDSVIYALVLSPAMKELLPQSGMANGPADIAFAGSILFALFLMGWGLSFLWGPLADRFGRAKCLAATILIFSVFTGAAALVPECLGAGLVSLSRRHRHRRRMGDGGHLYRRSLAGRPPQGRAPAICRPAIMPASSWRRRSTSPSARAMAGAPCSCAARRRCWWRCSRCRGSRSRRAGSRRMPVPRRHPLRDDIFRRTICAAPSSTPLLVSDRDCRIVGRHGL